LLLLILYGVRAPKVPSFSIFGIQFTLFLHWTCIVLIEAW
jgi:hypothetical protein